MNRCCKSCVSCGHVLKLLSHIVRKYTGQQNIFMSELLVIHDPSYYRLSQCSSIEKKEEQNNKEICLISEQHENNKPDINIPQKSNNCRYGKLNIAIWLLPNILAHLLSIVEE